MKVFTIRINDEDLETLGNASNKYYDENKHRKNFGIGGFMKEVSLKKAKSILKK